MYGNNTSGQPAQAAPQVTPQKTVVQTSAQPPTPAKSSEEKSPSTVLYIILGIVGISIVAGGTYFVMARLLNTEPEPEGTVGEDLKDSCFVSGVGYEDGEQFESVDECNLCYCQDGEVACTVQACDSDVSDEDDLASEHIEEEIELTGADEDLSFKIKLPEDAEVTEVDDGAYVDIVLSDDATLTVKINTLLFYEAYSSAEVIEGSKALNLYRVASEGIDDSGLHYYSSDVFTTGTCDLDDEETAETPCGRSVVEGFQVSCTWQTDGDELCDLVVKSFEAAL